MALLHACYFAATAAFCLVAIARWRAEPVLALMLGAVAFGAACGLSIGGLGKSFGTGFGNAAGSTGVAILGAALLGSMAEMGGAPAWLAGFAARRPVGVSAALPVLGLVAGMGASPEVAFAMLTPLRAALGRRAERADAWRLGLAISAGHGLMLPSPVLIAATTILGADWRMVLAAGVPCALAVTAVTASALRIVGTTDKVVSPPPATAPVPGRQASLALALASAVCVALLIVRSIGDMPSEPFGGGGTRELLLGLGQPLFLLLAGCAIMLPIAWHGFSASAAIGRAAPLVMLIGVAGGLQSLAQDTRMAEHLAESVASWHAGLLVPFAVAACLKILQGSSLVAAITAAGMVHELGMSGAGAALAVGAGAIAGANVNDALFWMMPGSGGTRVGFTVATLAQGMLALVLLQAVHSALGL
jgi:GntP family gluconate:H+ symporter